ncbi:pectinesterase family protein [Chitinophagaceae bacterium MMS25-I14]
MEKRSIIRVLIALCFCAFTALNASAQYSLVVAQDGSGDYTTVQAAINAAPAGQTTPYKIFIKNGRYFEKINIPSTKPFIQLIGESVANTILYYSDNANTPNGTGGTLGTQNSASITINGDDFSAINITFANTAGDVGQAVAVLINADRAVFKNCRFMGNQDTLYTKGNGTPRAYFLHCYIDGNTDFIFGSSVCLFDTCVIYAKIKPGITGSFITAPNTPTGQAYGYVFKNCRVTGNAGPSYYYLSRPWPSPSVAATAQKTVFLNTKMSNTVKAAGWTVWDANTDTTHLYYAEYKSRNEDLTLTDVSQRVTWSHQLVDTQAANYTMANLFGAWSPCVVSTGICTVDSVFAVSNFKGAITTANYPSFSWNQSWRVAQVKFELFRSPTRNGTYTLVTQFYSDTTFNYSYNDTVASGTFYYYLRASKNGYTTQYTDTLKLVNAPNILITGAPGNVLQNLGTPSAGQSYTVSGSLLAGDITIVPSANYEVSSNGTTWYNSSSALTLPQIAGSVAATTVQVRLNATAVGNYPGNIRHTSPGADTVNVAVTGVTSIYVPPASVVLQQWPLDMGNADSAAVRSAGVTASTPSFNKLFVSNGTTVALIPAYSGTFGQGICADAAGTGLWTAAVGGPGGTLNRTNYEQFTVTAATAHKVRVDSILLSSAFYNTSSNTKLAVVYSRSNFVSDSVNVTGGTGPSGALASSANGAFTTPVVLANQTAGTTNAYALGLDTAGIKIDSGQTITFRLYFSCSSSSTGRYGLLKNVMIKGMVDSPMIVVTGAPAAFTQNVGNPSVAAPYHVSGSKLTGGITIIPPANFEISADGGFTWVGNTSSIVLPQNGGVVADTQLLVRLNAPAAGAYSGNVTHTTPGGDTAILAVSGTATAVAIPADTVLQHWTMSVANTDSAGVRSPGVTASTSVLHNLHVSNGTTVATLPAYAPVSGQAFGASAAGDGMWTVSAGGPGSNLAHETYEEFTVSMQPYYKARIDSIVFNSAFYNTAGKVAIAYSLSNFTADSAYVAGGEGPTGTMFPTENGAFTTPVTLTAQATAPVYRYAFALTDTTGVNVDTGGHITFRLYFTTASVTAGSYAMLKDIKVKGRADTVAHSGVSVNNVSGDAVFAIYPNPAISGMINVTHPRAEAGAVLQLIDVTGKILLIQYAEAGASRSSMKLSGIAAGTYHIIYVDGNKRYVLLFVKM